MEAPQLPTIHEASEVGTEVDIVRETQYEKFNEVDNSSESLEEFIDTEGQRDESRDISMGPSDVTIPTQEQENSRKSQIDQLVQFKFFRLKSAGSDTAADFKAIQTALSSQQKRPQAPTSRPGRYSNPSAAR